MAATATELNKLSLADLTDKAVETQKIINELHGLESRDAQQDADLVDRLDEFEEIQNVVKAKKDHDINARIERSKSWDAPKARKTNDNGSRMQNFASLGDRLQAVSRSVNGYLDPRLRNALGANESTPSEGGFLVGEDNENDLMSKVYGSPILQLIPRTPISSGSNQLNLRQLKETSRADGSRQGGVQAYWGGEAATITASQQKFEKFSMSLEDLFALSYTTSQLLEDSTALEAEMSAGFNEEMTFKIEDAVVNGNGIEKPLGIMNSPAKVTVAAATGQTATDPLVVDNITAMYARLHPRSQLSAVWLVDQTLIPYLLTLTIGGVGGTPIYMPANNIAGAPFGTILGRPVLFTEYTQAANTEGDIILWDPQSYRIIEKGGIKQDSSMHVAFLTAEMAFRWMTRVNGGPKWRSALTPKNGGATLSTIVTLATRT